MDQQLGVPIGVGTLRRFTCESRVDENAAPKARFASRGDDSGTNRMELRLRKTAGVQPDPHNGWYRDLSQGMGPTLNIAAAMNA